MNLPKYKNIPPPPKSSNNMDKILNEIKQERIAQNEKWGQQDHGPMEWIAILVEEVGEASKEALDHHFKNPIKCISENKKTIYHPVDDEDQDLRLRAYRKEMIQVAAVAVQALECIDRNYFHKNIVE